MIIMKTHLNPVEKPNGIIMKLAYWLTKRKFGKVLTPLRVIYTRLPLVFLLFASKIEKLTKKVSISQELAYMIKTYVAQLNVCLFCVDIGKTIAVNNSLNLDKLFQLPTFRQNKLFNEAEKAALAFAEEITKTKSVSDETFSHLKNFYNERQICEITWLVASEHYYNIMNLTFNIHSDNLCQVKPRKKMLV